MVVMDGMDVFVVLSRVSEVSCLFVCTKAVAPTVLLNGLIPDRWSFFFLFLFIITMLLILDLLWEHREWH